MQLDGDGDGKVLDEEVFTTLIRDLVIIMGRWRVARETVARCHARLSLGGGWLDWWMEDGIGEWRHL